MPEKSTPSSIEDELMRELRFGGINKEQLKELVAIVATVHKVGLKSIKVFPIGIPPVVDGLRVSGFIEASNVNKILGDILMKTPLLSGVVVFPYGIPWPEIFRVNVDIGPTVQTQSPAQF